ncbi:hypothetical protein QJQ45_012859 [Haematococcus lacustris]|nr:hypothetical protein QJQ45_012859 [Haematococcus lacustris]
MANPVIPTPDTQDPHPPAEAEGWTQKYKNNTVSVLDLYNQLKQSNALRDTYRLKLDVTRKVVLLVCLLCGASLACCNLSHAQSQHDKHCKQRPAAEQPPPLPNPTGKQVHPDDQQLSDKYVALFVATTGTPHAALKNKFLKKAFRALGATCPSPKRVKTLIQDVYLQTRRTVEADLSSLFEAGMAVMMCTDGWRHRHAAQGHPLLNLVLLKPSSGVWFFDCYPLDRGAKKDARFYADMHNEMANKVQLICKVLGDCGKIRNALNCAQMTKYNKIQAVATHCATRFAILYLICVDLKRNQDALVMMVHSGEWETLRTASTNAAVFEELKSPSWWRKLDAVIRLMRPISNAIHRLEGDKPYLSQVLKIWDDLVAHAQNWVSELGHPGGLDKVDASFVRGVLRIFKDRALKHCQPVMAAAR